MDDAIRLFDPLHLPSHVLLAVRNRRQERDVDERAVIPKFQAFENRFLFALIRRRNQQQVDFRIREALKHLLNLRNRSRVQKLRIGAQSAYALELFRTKPDREHSVT